MISYTYIYYKWYIIIYQMKFITIIENYNYILKIIYNHKTKLYTYKFFLWLNLFKIKTSIIIKNIWCSIFVSFIFLFLFYFFEYLRKSNKIIFISILYYKLHSIFYNLYVTIIFIYNNFLDIYINII